MKTIPGHPNVPGWMIAQAVKDATSSSIRIAFVEQSIGDSEDSSWPYGYAPEGQSVEILYRVSKGWSKVIAYVEPDGSITPVTQVAGPKFGLFLVHRQSGQATRFDGDIDRSEADAKDMAQQVERGWASSSFRVEHRPLEAVAA